MRSGGRAIVTDELAIELDHLAVVLVDAQQARVTLRLFGGELAARRCSCIQYLAISPNSLGSRREPIGMPVKWSRSASKKSCQPAMTPGIHGVPGTSKSPPMNSAVLSPYK